MLCNSAVPYFCLCQLSSICTKTMPNLCWRRFKNVSWCTKWIPCIFQHPKITAQQTSWTRKTWSVVELCQLSVINFCVILLLPLQLLTWSAWNNLFSNPNSSHDQLMWSVGGLAWQYSILWHSSCIPICINILHISILLSTSDCTSDALVWTAHWKNSSRALRSDRILSLTFWKHCTLSKSRFRLSFRRWFPEAWNRLNFSPGILHAWMCQRTRGESNGTAHTSLSCENWRNQLSHVCCVVNLRCNRHGRKIVSVRVESVCCWLQRKTWTHTLSKDNVQSIGQSTTWTHRRRY